jgi:hypothetical protein
MRLLPRQATMDASARVVPIKNGRAGEQMGTLSTSRPSPSHTSSSLSTKRRSDQASIMGNDDAVDEGESILCCALGCCNINLYPAVDCLGCSGKVRIRCWRSALFGLGIHARVVVRQTYSTRISTLQAGICCCNLECCCKFNAPCLIPCCCVGIRPEYDGCSVINAQCQACCVVASIALPCNDEVPVALTIAGCTIFPTCGCCIQQKEIMRR